MTLNITRLQRVAESGYIQDSACAGATVSVDMTSLFFSYTHKDEALRDELEAHLALMKRQELIDVWHDRKILAGDSFDDTISTELERAGIILLLVSSDFIASNYCYAKEMTRAMQKHAAKEARVIPVILRACDWHTAPFGKLMAAPKDGKAVTTWPDRDVAFADVARQVRAAVESMNAAQARKPGEQVGTSVSSAVRESPAVASSAQATPSPFFTGPRSSNLRLKKEFTDLDRDNFVRECFEFMVKFFESSIDTIKERNPDIDGRLERIDSRRFAASLYRGGKAIAQCSVQRGGGASFSRDDASIVFSYGTSASIGSFNEQLSVEANDQALFMKALGMGSFSGSSEKQKLSHEGSAELYWGMFIARAQS